MISALRTGEDLEHVALLDDTARLQHGDAVRHGADHRHLMGDEHDGEAEFAIDPAQQRQDRPRGLWIEGGGGLVGEEHTRSGGQRAGDADPLLLPTREFGGIAVALILQPGQGQQLPDTGADRGPAAPFDLQRQGDVARDGAGREQVEMLEDHADAAAHLA